MRRLAVLSLHTSPLAQPGTGDGGGMNVYVRELTAALARSGVACDVFTRAWSADLPPVVDVEPGLRVHHVPAGALDVLPKESLPAVVDEFTAGVLQRMAMPIWLDLLCTSGPGMTAFMAALRMATTGFGVLAGTDKPFQLATS